MKNDSTYFSMRMKIFCILLIFNFCFVPLFLFAADGLAYTQETTLTIEVKNKTLKEVFDYIEKHSEFIFFYYDKAIDINRKVSLSVKDKSIIVILDLLFEGTDVKYEIKDRQISLKKDEAVKKQQNPSQQNKRKKEVKGTVTDIDGSPIIGANVTVKSDKTNGTITDLDGVFRLMLAPDDVLEITYIGYAKATTTIGDKSVLAIELKEDQKSLDEVVVVGYGVQKKVNLSGSVSAIEGDKIAEKMASDVLSALQGELPGVAVLRSSGQPGSETSGIQIRGASSVNETSTLVLIDGIEGDMTLLNPNDIASISVLKDAASCAIYGARAAAGVVLITTKNGSEGKPRISYNGYYAINIPGNMPERLTAWEEQDFINQSQLAAKGMAEWNAEKSSWIGNPNFNYRPLSNGRWDFFEATNWLAEGTRKTMGQQSHSVSVSGGTKSLNYMVSANYYTKKGILKYGADGNDRYNLHAKISSDINKHITLGVNVRYQAKEIATTSFGAGKILSLLYSARGRQPIYQPEEDINESPYNGDLHSNAIDIMKNGGSKISKYETFIGKADLTIKDFVKGLRVNLSASRKASYYSESSEKRHLIWYDRTGTGIRKQINNPNSLYKSKYSDYHDLLEATINYEFDIRKINKFNILVGSTYENYRKDEMSATAKQMNSNDFFSFNYYDTLIAANTELSDNIEPWAMMSYFGRINYNFTDRYLFEANVRYDGSSRLAPDKRWRAFPSVSAAWRVSQEKWFNLDFVSNMKLRLSWGKLGNGAVLGLYDYLPLISRGDDSYLGEGTYYQEKMASKDKTWEIISTTNLGIDLGFLNNRLTATFDYYWKFNDDMLSSLQLPHTIGINVPQVNVGRLKTWGWDFEVAWRDKIKGFNYQISANLSDSNNKLIEYNNANTIQAGSVSLLQGYSLNTIWGYRTNGYWASREEYLKYKQEHPGYQSFNDGVINGGDVKYVAQGAIDHMIGAGGSTPENPGDLVYLGTSNPRFLYGINLSAQWRGFDLAVMFQGVGKRKVLIEAEVLAPFYKTAEMPWTIHRDYWTEDNQNAYWPRIYQNNGNDFNFKPSDKWVQDASYIRLKNVTLGYTVPLFKKNIERLRVYVTGADIWEHSNLLKVFDPESDNNIVRDYYPFFRSWTFGLNLTF